MKKTKVFLIVILGLGILFAVIFTYKHFKKLAIKKYQRAYASHLPNVSATRATKSIWNSEIKIVGSTRAVKGVNVTTELAGMVTEIHFKPGIEVKKGQLLVQLDINPEIAQLHEYQAQADIARITYYRDLRQYAVGGVSKETVDQDAANVKSTAAQVAYETAIIAQKTIRAPFSGRMGISLVYPGQYLNPGDSISSLQTIKPIYIDFYIPQNRLPILKVGQQAEITFDTYPNEKFIAPVTTINPIVDKTVRNVIVEATHPNEDFKLLPGMFAYVTLDTGKSQEYITLPQMAITYNPYGSIIFILKQTDKKINGQDVWQANQTFVTTGEVRGNQVAIEKGVNEGDVVVTSGQLKIKNGSLVVVNNSIQPPENSNPNLPTE